MNNQTLINDGWIFEKEGERQIVNLPHTYNNIDGQGGGEGYYRGVSNYYKNLKGTDKPVYIRFEGVNSTAKVYVNGNLAAAHAGGYSAFNVNLTKYLTNQTNELRVEVSNADDKRVYPAMADFTFYGGIYRDVYLIEAEECRFSLDDCGGSGIYVTSKKGAAGWDVEVKAMVTNPSAGTLVNFAIYDAEGRTVSERACNAALSKAVLQIAAPVLWQGIENPYLYKLEATLWSEGVMTDKREVEFGLREIVVDKDEGFFLNGKYMKIRGVSRHQDRENMGNALTAHEHEEDIALILEAGANAVRLAHYQQSDYFYSLCDRSGLLVWAEVPVISRFSKKRQKNAESQLTELIKQNYNHPSIFCWGIQNEITISGGGSGKLYKNLLRLNAIAHNLDPVRPTTSAQVTMCAKSSPLNTLTDLLGYNHYFGWYMGVFDDLGSWLEAFRREQPEVKLCLSEYGAEGIVAYHSDNPVQGDYSEDYQAVLHENYIKHINSNKWLWGSFVWNMFDFGSAARNEGGVRGRNNKGLVTFDRKIKKDAFYLYKAYWSDEPFVHVCGARYIKRPAGQSTIKIYSNLPEVTLTVNGKRFIQSGDKVFVFEGIELKTGVNAVTAAADGVTDSIAVEGVDAPYAGYAMPEGGRSMVVNWFGIEGGGSFNPDCFSVEDKVGALLNNAEVYALIAGFAGKKIKHPLLNAVRMFKLKTLLNIAGISTEMQELINRYLQRIKKC